MEGNNGYIIHGRGSAHATKTINPSKDQRLDRSLGHKINGRLLEIHGRGVIREKKKKRVEENGFVPLRTDFYDPSRTTLNNYKALIVAKSDVITTSNTEIGKSNSRYISENSLISSVALLLVVSATHYIVVEEEDHDVRKDM